MIERAQRIYLQSSFWILVFSGLSKLVVLLRRNPALATTPDPLFSYLSSQHLLLIASLLELAVAASLLSPARFMWKSGSVLALTWVLVFYRLGLKLSGWNNPCKCFGDFPQLILPNAHALVDKMLVAILLYFLVVGSALCYLAVRETAKLGTTDGPC
jgi:hypothetical protein